MENVQHSTPDQQGQTPETAQAAPADTAHKREHPKKHHKHKPDFASSEQETPSKKAKKAEEDTEKPKDKHGNKHSKKRKKQSQSEDGGASQAQSTAAAEKTAKKGKKAKNTPVSDDNSEGVGVVPIPDLLPKQEERSAEPQQRFDSGDILHRKYKRPEKKVIPSLANVSLLPTIELKETFESVGDSLDLRRPTKTLPKTDATARMFAEPKSVPEKFRSSGSGSQRKPKNDAEAIEETAGNSKKSKRNKPKKSSAPKKAKDREQRVVFTVAHDSQKKQTSTREAHDPATPKRHVLRIPARVETPSRQKDSTEQESLMKPYYLSDRKK